MKLIVTPFLSGIFSINFWERNASIASSGGVLPRNSRRTWTTTMQPQITHHKTHHTSLCLLWQPVFLVLLLTIVTLQACMCLHRDGRPLPAIRRSCPTLGWLHLVQSLTRRAAASVALAAPVAIADMWSRAEVPRTTFWCKQLLLLRYD